MIKMSERQRFALENPTQGGDPSLLSSYRTSIVDPFSKIEIVSFLTVDLPPQVSWAPVMWHVSMILLRRGAAMRSGKVKPDMRAAVKKQQEFLLLGVGNLKDQNFRRERDSFHLFRPLTTEETIEVDAGTIRRAALPL